MRLALLLLLGGGAWLAAQQLPAWYPRQSGGSMDLGPAPALAWVSGLIAAGLMGWGLTLWRQRRQLAHGQAHWRDALAMASLGCAEWDLQRGRAWFSPLWRQATGLAPALVAHPCDWLQAAHPVDRMRVDETIRRMLQSSRPEPVQETLRLSQHGEQDRWYQLRMQVQAGSGLLQSKRVLATLEDISWRRTAEERQRQSVALFQHVHDGLLITDERFTVLDANPAYLSTMKTSREALLGKTAPPLQAIGQQTRLQDRSDWQTALRQHGHWRGLVQAHRGDDTPCVLELALAPIPEPEGRPRFHVLTVTDVTRQNQQRAQLEHQGRQDLLTGLPNRADFKRMVGEAQRLSQTQGFLLCVCRLDLDHFADFNEKWGQALGDVLLQDMAQRLQRSLRSTLDWHDQVARLDGDEFALLLRCQDMNEVRQALDRLQQVVKQPFKLAGQTDALHIEASLGATIFPADDGPAETLLRHAAQALYRTKAAGRQSWQLFDTAERQQADAKQLALTRVQAALDRGELQLHYQPKVHMRTGRVRGAEALLRWQHPERGLLTPVHFLQAIENTPLAQQLGEWVLEQALEQSAAWQAQGLSLDVSVNVSARQLQSQAFLLQLKQLLAQHHARVAQHLVLEVLESEVLADLESTQALLLRCKNLGVRVALDDFGTGFSNLNHLKHLPVDALKIDRSFVASMLDNEQDRALVEGVIRLAHSFDCVAVAEGVRSQAHVQALLEMGCEWGQGSGIAHAMPAADFHQWVSRFEAAPDFDARHKPPADPIA